MQNLLGGIFGLKCLWADDIAYAERCGDDGEAGYLLFCQFIIVKIGVTWGSLNTFIVYPLKFAPVQAKIRAKGATVYHLSIRSRTR